MEPKAKAQIALLAGVIVCFALLLVACAAYRTWWPMFNMCIWAILPLPLAIRSFGNADDYEYDEAKLVWMSLSNCLIAVLGVSTVGLPFVMYSVDKISAAQLAWTLASDVALGFFVGLSVKWWNDAESEDGLLA